MDNATVVVSGTKIADEIGTNRSEVWRLVQQLRTLGVEIAGHPATGYQLKAVPDLLLPDMLAPFLKGTIFAQEIHHYYKLDRQTAKPWRVPVRARPKAASSWPRNRPQDEGAARISGIRRPRRESTVRWCCVRCCLRPRHWFFRWLPGLPCMLRSSRLTPAYAPDLKWPNDLLIEGKKFCGILTEMNAEVTRVRYIVVGIGINVNQARFPEELQPIATSLRLASGTEWSRVELCAALLKSLDREYRELLNKPGRAGIDFEAISGAVIIGARL